MTRVRAKACPPYCPPLAETPRERVSAFVGLARAMRRHGCGDGFNAPRWDVTDTVARRAGVPARPGRLTAVFGPEGDGAGAMAAVGLFLRAYVGMLPAVGYARLAACASAGAPLAVAMERLGAKTVSDITVAVLNEAAALARSGASGNAAVARAVREIGSFLAAHGMTSASLAGMLPPPPVARLPARSEDGHAARSARLLPSDRFLEVLSEAHALASETADVVVTRVAVVLMSAPGRANEALALEEAPEVEREVDGVAVLGLRWRGSKGASDGVKWVAPQMAAASREACRDLCHATAEGRRMKLWYGEFPKSLYLLPEFEHLRGRVSLTDGECGALLGRRPGPGLQRLLAALRTAGPASEAPVVSFAAVEAHLLTRLPRAMADAGGPSCRPLLVVPWGTFDAARRPPCPCMFETVKYRHVADALAGPLFRRLGLDPDGALGGRTHSFRHWLVTEALRGGLPAADVAAWCWRTGREGNRAYDHRTAAEMRALVRRASSAGGRERRALAPISCAGPTPPVVLRAAR